MGLTIVEALPLVLMLSILLGLIGALWRMRDVSAPESASIEQESEASTGVSTGRARGPRRRRGGLARMRQAASATAAVSADGDDAGNDEDDAADDDQGAGASSSSSRSARVKKKKEANREARRAAREEQEAALAAKREREEKAEEERRVKREQEEEKERQEEERLKEIAREKERKEQEEYEQWKDLITVEEAGEEAEENEEDPAMLERFITYIKDNKIVVIEELAAEFNLKTEHAIQRLKQLEEDGTITGVFDDRGKFIFVSEEEMKEVAQFITRRGRVSIAELASESTKLLHLENVAAAM